MGGIMTELELRKFIKNEIFKILNEDIRVTDSGEFDADEEVAECPYCGAELYRSELDDPEEGWYCSNCDEYVYQGLAGYSDDEPID